MEVRPYVKLKTKPNAILPASDPVGARPTIIRERVNTGHFRGWGTSL